MNLFENPETIKQLRQLLRDPNLPSSDTDLDIDDDEPAPNSMASFSKSKPNQLVDEMMERFLLGPGSIGPKTTARRRRKRTTTGEKLKDSQLRSKEKSPEKSSKSVKKNLEDPYKEVEEWLEGQEKLDDLVLEDRKRPEYSISYKQAVGTEDMYLQMGNKTASTTSCEDMVIIIKLPEETVGIDEMFLHVTEDEIDLKTPKYRLKLPLTQKIDPDKGRARYDTQNKILKLTLRMTREFDFVNF